MYQPRIQDFGFVAAVAINVLATTNPIQADELARNLGPVGPHQPILASVGTKRVIAFYVPNGGHCAVDATVWERADAAASSAARFRVSLKPRQVVHVEAAENASLTLQCGHGAKTLAIVGPRRFIAAGPTE